jgi:hypothetical protein
MPDQQHRAVDLVEQAGRVGRIGGQAVSLDTVTDVKDEIQAAAASDYTSFLR